MLFNSLARKLVEAATDSLNQQEQERLFPILASKYPDVYNADGTVKSTVTDKQLHEYFKDQDFGRDLKTSLTFEGCNNPYHAQAKAISELLKSRYQNVISFSMKNTGILYEPGDYLYLDTDSFPQLQGIYLLITSVSVNENNTVDISGLSFDPGLLAWNELAQRSLIGKKSADFTVSPPRNLTYSQTAVNQEYSSGSLTWDPPLDNNAYEYLVLAANTSTPNDLFVIGTTRSTYIDFPIFKSQNLNFFVYTINSLNKKSTEAATLNNQAVSPVILDNANIIVEPNNILVKRSQVVGSTSPTFSNVTINSFLGTTTLTYSALGNLPPKSWAIVTQNGNLPSNQGTYTFNNNTLVFNFNQEVFTTVDLMTINVEVVINPTDETLPYQDSKCLFFTKSIYISQVLDLTKDRVYSADLSLYRYSVADISNQFIIGGSYDLLDREYDSLPQYWYPTPEEALENAVLPADAEYGDLYRIDSNVQTYYPTTVATNIVWQASRLANNTVISRDIPVYYRRGYNGVIPTATPTGGSFTFPFGPLVVPTNSSTPAVVWSETIPDGAGDIYQSTARFSRVGNNGINTNTLSWSFPRRIFQNPMASRTLVVYYRKSINDPLPTNPPVGGDFSFPDGPITLPTDLNPSIIWSETIPTGLGSVYESRAYVENLSNQGLAQNTVTWSQPRKIVDGVILNADLVLYKWSISEPTISSGTSDYNWLTSVHNNLSSGLTNNGWSLEFPKYQGQGSLWLAKKSISADAGTEIVQLDWTTNTTIGVANPNEIPNSKRQNVVLYRWALSIPTITGTAYYKWIDGTLVDINKDPINPPTGWSLNPVTTPSAGFTLYTATVSLLDAFSAETTIINWGQSVITTVGFAAEGIKGDDGDPGAQGASTRIAYGKSTLAVNNDTNTVTTTGNASFPASDAWDFTGVTWGSSIPALSTNEYLWQANGVYNPVTNNTVWESPFLATFKVGQLSAIATNTGSLNANQITVATDGYIRSGKEYFEDPNNEGFFLGKDGSTTKFEIGNDDGSKSIKWDGENLSINGSEIVVPRSIKSTTHLVRYKALKSSDFLPFEQHTGFLLNASFGWNDSFGFTQIGTNSRYFENPITGQRYYSGAIFPAFVDANDNVKTVYTLQTTGTNQDLFIGASYWPYTNGPSSPMFIPAVKREWFNIEFKAIPFFGTSFWPYLSSSWNTLPKFTSSMAIYPDSKIVVPSVENGFAYVLSGPTSFNLPFIMPSTEPTWSLTEGGTTSVTGIRNGQSLTVSFRTIAYPSIFLWVPIAPDERYFFTEKNIQISYNLNNEGFLPANYFSTIDPSRSGSSTIFNFSTGTLLDSPIGDSLDIDSLSLNLDFEVDIVGLQGLSQLSGARNSPICIYYTPTLPSIYFSGLTPTEISNYIRNNIIAIGSTSTAGPISLFGIKEEGTKQGFYSIAAMYYIAYSVGTWADYVNGFKNDQGKLISWVYDRNNFENLYNYVSRFTENSVLVTGFRE